MILLIFLISILILFFIPYIIFLAKQSNNKKINSIGIDYLIHQYLKKSFQKVSLSLLKQKISKTNVLSNEILEYENAFFNQVKSSIIQKLIYFNRCHEILSKINENLTTSNYESFNLFLLPDVIIKDNLYYHHLLFFTSSIFSNDIIDLNNEDSKLYLSQL